MRKSELRQIPDLFFRGCMCRGANIEAMLMRCRGVAGAVLRLSRAD
jgi:hypothetical protein